MKDKKKLLIFIGLFILANLMPFLIVVNKTPIYIIWLDNASLTMYLLSVKSKRYRILGIIISFFIEIIHCGVLLYNYEMRHQIIIIITISILNILNAFIIFKLLDKSKLLIETTLQEIISITFFKVVPVIVLLGIIQDIIFEMNTKGTIDYKFYNFFLSNLLGYVFLFTVFYTIMKSKKDKFTLNSEFFIFFIVVFVFNTEEVYSRNIFDMNRSHLEYISIFILVLSCILLKAEEFLILIIEDFIVSFSMITLFMNNLSGPSKEYLLSDVQLFYTIVLTTCFFLIILKTENRDLLKEIRIKNKKLAKEVVENKEMLKKVDILIDTIKNTAFIADEKGNIVYSNKSFKSLIQENNIYKLSFFREAVKELRSKEAKTLRKEVRIGDIYLMQEIFISKYDDNIFISGIGTDITRLKNIQGKLEESKEMAEEANNAKSSLLARVSHELKTPMNTITGINYLLSESDLQEKQREYVKKIESASTLLLRMIEDILDVSKNSESKMKIDKGCISLNKVIATTIFVKEDEILKKGLKFIKEIDKELPKHIISDEFRLEQVLINLIGNSIKFTSTGYIKLSVKLKWKDGLRYGIRFIVEDTGIGIEKERYEKIFEAFTQEDESITRKYGGTGLGLTICKNIIDEFDGKIIVESEKGEGSRFIVDIEVLECLCGKEEGDIGELEFKEKLEDDSEVVKREINVNEALEELEQLDYYLKNDIGEAIDSLKNSEDIFKETKFWRSLEKIKILIDNFEIDKASLKLDELKNEILRV